MEVDNILHLTVDISLLAEVVVVLVASDSYFQEAFDKTAKAVCAPQDKPEVEADCSLSRDKHKDCEHC